MLIPLLVFGIASVGGFFMALPFVERISDSIFKKVVIAVISIVSVAIIVTELFNLELVI